MTRRSRTRIAGLAAALGILLPGAAASRAADAPRVTFDHVLSDFTGPVRVGEARVAVDRASGEVLVAEGRDVRVFNRLGMQVFGFRTAVRLGAVLDVAVDPRGDVILLALELDSIGDRPRAAITRHDFRGVPRSEIALSGLPPPFARILPNRVFLREHRLVLADTAQWLAVVVGPDGTFESGLDLARILGIPEDERATTGMTGIALDRSGNVLLTAAVLFRAFAVSPDGRLLASWGEPGAVPGTFGHAAGIAGDRLGRTWVVDKNRKVVLAFDEAYRFLGEFGSDPADSRLLGLPSGIVLDDEGRAYVTQIGHRGVWVYDVRPF